LIFKAVENRHLKESLTCGVSRPDSLQCHPLEVYFGGLPSGVF